MEQKYIVGDLLKFILDDGEQVVKVIGYDPTYERYLLTNEYIEQTRGCISVAEDRIKPIPLTPKILKKNGWKNDGYDWYKLPTKRAYLYITKDITTLGEFLVCVGLDKHNLASINFVHQLQHLLFGLELNSEMEV